MSNKGIQKRTRRLKRKILDDTNDSKAALSEIDEIESEYAETTASLTKAEQRLLSYRSQTETSTNTIQAIHRKARRAAIVAKWQIRLLLLVFVLGGIYFIYVSLQLLPTSDVIAATLINLGTDLIMVSVAVVLVQRILASVEKEELSFQELVKQAIDAQREVEKAKDETAEYERSIETQRQAHQDLELRIARLRESAQENLTALEEMSKEVDTLL